MRGEIRGGDRSGTHLAMNKRKVLLIVGLVLLIGCCAIFYYIDKKVSRWELNRQYRAEEISEALGIEPDWDEILEYVDCTILAYGNSKKEVLDQFSLMGEYYLIEHEYTSEDTIGIEVRFNKPGFKTGVIIAGFDSSGLISKDRLYGLGEPVEMICP